MRHIAEYRLVSAESMQTWLKIAERKCVDASKQAVRTTSATHRITQTDHKGDVRAS